MALNENELAQLRELPTRSAILVFFHATRRHWGKVADLARVVGLSQRRVELELRELEQKGWLQRHEKGARNYTRLVRFELGSAIQGSRSTDPGDRGAPILEIAEQRSPGSGNTDPQDRGTAIARDRGTLQGARASDPDLSLLGRSKAPYRPSVSGGVTGEGTDGRTGGEKLASLRNELVSSLHTEWDLSAKVVTACLTRFLRECPSLTERELRQYLRAALRCRDGEDDAGFPGLVEPDKPVNQQPVFGRACTVDRLEQWRKSQRGEVHNARPRMLELACIGCERPISVPRSEVPATAKAVKCRHCGARTPLVAASENQAIGELVKQAGLASGR